MSKFKKLSAISLAAMMAFNSSSLPTWAHTEAIGYVVVAPGDVDVWFGTYHLYTESPQLEGHALLTLPDTSQQSVAFTLPSPTVPTGLTVGQNLILNTAGGYTSLSQFNSWEGAVFTGLTEVGTYTVTLDPAFPTMSQKWAVGFPGVISFTFNPNVNSLTVPLTNLTSNERGIVSSVNTAMLRGGSGPALGTLSIGLMVQASNPSTYGGIVDQLSPSKFASFASTTAFNNETFEIQDMDTYFAGERTAQGTFTVGSSKLDASGFVVNDPNIDPGLQMLHSRMLAWNVPASAVSDVPNPALGGIDMKDVKNVKNVSATDQPWNFFLRGNVVLAQGFSQQDVPHFDDNTSSVVAGADYRFTDHFLAGLSASYAHTDATLDTFNSSATVDSYSPGVYASYADSGWYANFIGRYSYNSYTEARNIDFLHQTANGDTTGNEGMVDLDGGYDFHSGPWTYGPVAGLQYTHLTVNGYQERNSDASLAVTDDESDSLRSKLGGEVRFDLRECGIKFTPHLEATWLHEFMDQSRGLTSQFTQFSGGSFTVRTPHSSQDSALVDVGLDAQVDKTITVFADYLVQAGQSNYFGQSVQAGVKINF